MFAVAGSAFYVPLIFICTVNFCTLIFNCEPNLLFHLTIFHFVTW